MARSYLGRDKGKDGKYQPEIAYRMSIVAEMYIEGKTQNQIANELKIAQGTVSKDLMKIRDEWKQRMAENYGYRVAEELARIDHLEKAAWAAWERSCEDAETKVRKREMALPRVKDDGKDKKGRKPTGKQELVTIKVVKESTTRGQTGDPRFLAQIEACIDMRLRIIGAYKVEDPTGNNKIGSVFMNWDEFYTKMGVTDPVDAAVNALPEGEQQVITTEPSTNGKHHE